MVLSSIAVLTFAAHTVRSAINYCKINALSVFVLFVDLVKAFDKAIRELVFGMPDSVDLDPYTYLRQLQVPHDAALWISQYLQHNGSLFQK